MQPLLGDGGFGGGFNRRGTHNAGMNSFAMAPMSMNADMATESEGNMSMAIPPPIPNRAFNASFSPRPELVNEYKERHFYYSDTLPLEDNNYFWYDFANFLLTNTTSSGHEFLSDNVILKSNSISDLIFVLSVLDLPMKSKTNQVISIYSNGNYTITPQSNIILATKEFISSPYKQSKEIFITQKITDKESQTTVETEYGVHKIYQQQVSLINMADKETTVEEFGKRIQIGRT